MDVRQTLLLEYNQVFRCFHVLDLGEVFEVQNLEGISFTSEASFPSTNKSSCYCVKCVMHHFISLALRWLFGFVWPRASSAFSPAEVTSLCRVRWVALHIFFKVSLMYQLFLLLSWAARNPLYDVPWLYGTCTTFQVQVPSSWPWEQVILGCCARGAPWSISIISGYSDTWNFPPFYPFFWTWICPSRERCNCFPWRMWALGAGDTLFNIASFLFSIVFLAFDVTLIPGNYLGQCECQLKGEGLIEVSFLQSIFELPHEHFLIHRDFLDGSLVEIGEVVSQQLLWALANVK